jgi:hypothetical protein
MADPDIVADVDDVEFRRVVVLDELTGAFCLMLSNTAWCCFYCDIALRSFCPVHADSA